jgi:hypothetical protein
VLPFSNGTRSRFGSAFTPAKLGPLWWCALDADCVKAIVDLKKLTMIVLHVWRDDEGLIWKNDRRKCVGVDTNERTVFPSTAKIALLALV